MYAETKPPMKQNLDTMQAPRAATLADEAQMELEQLYQSMANKVLCDLSAKAQALIESAMRDPAATPGQITGGPGNSRY